jgi:hypothetical protein
MLIVKCEELSITFFRIVVHQNFHFHQNRHFRKKLSLESMYQLRPF